MNRDELASKTVRVVNALQEASTGRTAGDVMREHLEQRLRDGLAASLDREFPDLALDYVSDAAASDPLDADSPTRFATEKIPRIATVYWSQPDRGRGQRRVADLVGIGRSTLTDWLRRGWLTWPPARSDQSSDH